MRPASCVFKLGAGHCTAKCDAGVSTAGRKAYAGEYSDTILSETVREPALCETRMR